MECFNWLHLTDLHWGSDDHRDYWGSIEPKWFEDIDRLKEKCDGEWNAVFFTGDLVNKGEKSEFTELTGQLNRLFNHLKKTGSEPYLLVIPGNHDLKRPTPSAAGCKALTHLWDTDEEIRNTIWRKKKDTDYWKTIQAAFENFQQWLADAKNHFPIPPGMKPGLLPGEFAVTLEKSDNKIGVIGLNTAFLQLSKGLYKGKLDAHPAQVIELCDKNHQDWVNQHDVCLILTHHPVEWLSPLGKDEFESVIAPPGRFALHLCGHQHEALLSQFTLGGAPDARRFICGCSLFGLQKYVDWQNNAKINRRHGYSAGCIDFSKKQPVLRIWPRLGLKKSDKVWSFDRDQEFYLEDDGGIKEILLETKRKDRLPILVGKTHDNNGVIGGDNGPQVTGILTIKTLVKENIIKLLGRKKMERFRQALNNRLNEGKKQKEQYEIDQMAAMLIDMSVLDAVLTLDLAVKDCIEAIKDADGSVDLINSTWLDSVSILGWIVLPGVDDEWANATSRCLADKGEHLDLVIPVITPAGAEIAYSRLKQAKAHLRIDESTKEVRGEQEIPCDDWDIEDGWHTPDKVITIKKSLWKQLIKADPGSGEFTKNMDAELNQTLLTRRKKGEHHYIAINRSCQNNPLLEEDVYKALLNDLPDLEIFIIGSGDQGVAIIGEPELHAQLREFFRNQPE
jgi:hypothetical protein